MSTALVKAEIQRFLASDTPEVLCVKGKWGVGKTFAWLQYLREAESSGSLALNRYAYVSLFGFGDLEALRYSIFESTVPTGQFISGPNLNSLRALLEGAGTIGRKARPLVAPLLNAIGVKDAGEALSRAAFLTVRNQYICFDDLERRGAALSIRDVLGLVSMLKEQRRCKLILLLNDERLDEDDRGELQRQLEKVVDVSLVFEPSAAEAAEIAFADRTDLSDKICPKVIKLGITNIRVIKKIERFSQRLVEILADFREEVSQHGIHAVVLGGWCVLQPDSAPPIDYVKRYNRILATMGKDDDERPEEQKCWDEILEAYGWAHTDDLDLAIFEGVIAGYFDEQRIRDAGAALQRDYQNSREHSAFSKAWRLYHSSLAVEDDQVLDALYEGAKQSLPTISPLNLNAAVTLFREFARDQQADEIIDLYMAQPSLDPGSLAHDVRIWGSEKLDPKLLSAFETAQSKVIDDRDPKAVMIAMAANQGWAFIPLTYVTGVLSTVHGQGTHHRAILQAVPE